MNAHTVEHVSSFCKSRLFIETFSQLTVASRFQCSSREQTEAVSPTELNALPVQAVTKWKDNIAGLTIVLNGASLHGFRTGFGRFSLYSLVEFFVQLP
jgi:hypothetical protein